jgi:outer membrane protein OmpA-like peptidoglycan-associated protein
MPAAPRPPRVLSKPVAPPKAIARPVPKAVVRVAPKAAPKVRKPAMPRALSRPVAPPPPPRIAKTTAPTAPPPIRRAAKPARKAPPSKPAQTASRTPSGGKLAPGSMVRLGFKSGQAKLAAPVVQQLDGVIRQLAKETSLRLQLLAYADGAATSGSQARRLSLSRALAVRSYLIEKGIRSTRIDVRALGSQVKGSPADRVDLIITNR